ncbi:unnamed protein product [Meganyctiphanes norvegica]|uniref:Uncharacterized protein n=1 Tax=Meganyctiphanes norvegica TaxID=48144 RepID=A0AAV2S3N2_MEGNR
MVMSTQELVSVGPPVGLKIKFAGLMGRRSQLPLTRMKFAGLMGRRSQLPLTRRVSLVHIFRGVSSPVGLKIKFAGLMGRRSQLPLTRIKFAGLMGRRSQLSLTRRVSLVHIFRGGSPDWSVGS